jgi:predicted dithiol-disulfide oxidoreductase (DUF899 family)
MAEPATKRTKSESEAKGSQGPNAVVSRDDWLVARKALLNEEKAAFRARLALAAKRQALPWVKIPDYQFQGPSGPVNISELFGDANDLVVYHVMQGETEEEACQLCCFWMDGFNGTLHHLKPRVNVVGVAAAPYARLAQLKKVKGWDIEIYSAQGSTFNHDFAVEFTEAEQKSNEKIYNYGHSTWSWCDQAPGLSVFHRENGEVYHTYSTYGPGLSEINVVFSVLDIIPAGRNEGGGNSMYWIKHKEQYGQPEKEKAE